MCAVQYFGPLFASVSFGDFTRLTVVHTAGSLRTNPSLRFEVSEAAQILRMSRAQVHNRIHDGSLKPQKDGARTYITRADLERYVQACGL
jgi:excisionase family DNA binding protein